MINQTTMSAAIFHAAMILKDEKVRAIRPNSIKEWEIMYADEINEAKLLMGGISNAITGQEQS